jgi:hypothetical protein
MAIGLIFHGAGVTQAQYEQALQAVAPSGQLPAGLLHHAAGPSESGWCVMEVWESQEDLQRFFQDTLGAALQAAGITDQPTTFEIVNTMDHS